MKNRIDLSKFHLRTDLIIDHDITNCQRNYQKINDNIGITTIRVDDNLSKEIHKESGTYTTIEFIDITNHEDKIEIEKYLTQELSKFLKILNIKERDEGLIIGLGNRFSTPDSLGPKVIDSIMVTRHLFELNTNVKEGIRSIAAISPGVMANTGIETFDIIDSIIKRIQPKFVIVIDALASSSIDRINQTIQLTDTGIHPGSGVGNHRKELSSSTLGIPVLAIGVPTVVESSIIVNDTINYIFKHISYLKEHYDTSKLVFRHSKNYIHQIKDLHLTEQEKKELSGILGVLPDRDKISLINEVLGNLQYNMIVTPKEIDFLIDSLGTTIANAINKSLHSALQD